MKQRHILLLASSLVMVAAIFFLQPAKSRESREPVCDETLLPVLDGALDRSLEQSMMLYERVADTPGLMPRTYDARRDSLILSPVHWWASGFFAGTLWYLYEYTGREDVRQKAETLTRRMEPWSRRTNDHDIGFAINCTYGNGYRLTGKSEYRDVLLRAARNLMTRFSPEVGCIRSWNNRPWGYTVIIDNMMNLELLTVATQLTVDSTALDMARSHADITLRNHFRPDYSSYHVVGYDEQTGRVLHRVTHQGQSDSSAWARGQAWALYGYTMMYRQTRDKRYLDQAQHIGRFIMNHPRLPEDRIPYWDFDAPDIPDAGRDASAGAIMASAFIELATFAKGEAGKGFLKMAEAQLRSLCSRKYMARSGENGGFLLMHSSGFHARGTEVDAPLSYADYYFVEAMIRYKRLHATGSL